tara:strand:+ start:205 stop:522 length:318 start_codon:yes stop_codon:yes gene_type:complete
MKTLGYIFLFYIAYYFYRLAENHKKNKWLFGVVGVVTYIFGNFMYVVFTAFNFEQNINNLNLLFFSLKSFIIGLLSVFTLFHSLNFIWNRKRSIKKEDIDKIGEN